MLTTTGELHETFCDIESGSPDELDCDEDWELVDGPAPGDPLSATLGGGDPIRSAPPGSSRP